MQASITFRTLTGWDNKSTGRSDWYLQHSAGIVFALSKGTDSDADGVPDRRDKCASTPAAVTVDKMVAL
jgi:hypothetical protein